MEMDADSKVLVEALKVLTTSLNELVSACHGPDGKIKAPDMRDVMRARSMLPPQYSYTLTKKG
jgi:hypothetical protein